MTNRENNIDDFLGKRLETLRQVPDRDDRTFALGRERYLSEMRTLLEEKAPEQAVSESPIWRLNRWISNIIGLRYRRKERVPMLATLMALILSISLLFGGAGATAYAAENSLPDDFLYPLKTIAEDARLDLTSNPQSEVDLLLTYADRRVDEIISLSFIGEAVPESVVNRLGDHYQTIFLIITGLEEPEAMEALEDVGVHIRKHDRDMDQVRTYAPRPEDPEDPNVQVMNQVRNMFRLGHALVDTGLEDFEAFVENFEAYQWRWQWQHGPADEIPPDDGGFGPGPGAGDPACEECEPAQDGSGPGPGPGPGDPACEECEPAQDGSGPGPGPGPSNQGDETNPDEGYGPSGPYGTPACEECTPSYGDDATGPMGPPPSDTSDSSSSSNPSNGSDNGQGESKGK
jgi:hypothetical protein